MINSRKAISLALVLLAGGGILVSRHWRASANKPTASVGESSPISFDGNTMGGTWSVKLNQLPPGFSRETLETSVGKLLARLDGQMSIWKPQSELSRFNLYRGREWFSVPRELADVISRGQEVSAQTNGTFDMTVGPLVQLWGFGPQKTGGQVGAIPSDEAIAAARVHVGHHLLECRLSPPALRKLDPDVYVDLGAIAKGYAAEAVAKELESHGVMDYLVAIGGELRARGSSHTGEGWRVGIETPTPDVRRVFQSLELKDASLSTSGDYRNFFELAGVRYCHEIDPRTGRPIPAGLASVSVIHPSGAYADAMATAMMVLGPQEGYDTACRLKLAVLFIIRKSDHFETLETPEFAVMIGSKKP